MERMRVKITIKDRETYLDEMNIEQLDDLKEIIERYKALYERVEDLKNNERVKEGQ